MVIKESQIVKEPIIIEKIREVVSKINIKKLINGEDETHENTVVHISRNFKYIRFQESSYNNYFIIKGGILMKYDIIENHLKDVDFSSFEALIEAVNLFSKTEEEW